MFFATKNNLKLLLLLVFLIFNFFSKKIFIYRHEKLLETFNITDSRINDISDETYLNESFENGRKNNSLITCFSSNKKIYWKNETDLEIEKLKEEIINNRKVNISFENVEDFYKREHPKISIIITIYNQAYYIKSLYAHIQNQELKDIEIIFVDDVSTDNSFLIIKELMEKDKRIIYLKNDINRHQFYSINYGVLNSKGEYIHSVDADDFHFNNILIKAYETAKTYNLDILQFYMISGMSLWETVKYKSGIICNNQNIRNIYYYGITRNLPDKLIRRSIFIKAINFIDKKLYYEDYHIHPDDTSFFGIIRFANSYGFLEQIGYFYNQDPDRKPKLKIKKNKKEIINKDIKSYFNIMKYFILQSDNNTIEKNNIPYRFFIEHVKDRFEKEMKFLIRDFDFYIEVLNLFLNCPFLANEKKEIFQKLKHRIILKRRHYI